jgi:putative phosphoesterase
MTKSTGKLIGIISDTHGLVRPEALRALKGVEMILHAGDIGKQEVLDALKGIAPVVAVRGNNDKGEWARSIPETAVVKVGKVSIYMLHDLKEIRHHLKVVGQQLKEIKHQSKEIDVGPSGAGFRVVVSGHSHKPSVTDERGVLYVNPGSAGPRRFTLPVSLAHLHIRGEKVEAQIVELL